MGTVSKALGEATVLVLHCCCWGLPGQPAGRGDGGAGAAAVSAGHLHPDALVRHVGQPDEPGRSGHRAGHAGGRAVVVVETSSSTWPMTDPGDKLPASIVFGGARGG